MIFKRHLIFTLCTIYGILLKGERSERCGVFCVRAVRVSVRRECTGPCSGGDVSARGHTLGPGIDMRLVYSP